jgi:hypothetical protein
MRDELSEAKKEKMHHVCRCMLWFLAIPIIYIYTPEDRACDIPSFFWLRYRWIWLCLYNALNLPIHLKYGGLFVDPKGATFWGVKLIAFYFIGSIHLIFGLVLILLTEETCG